MDAPRPPARMTPEQLERQLADLPVPPVSPERPDLLLRALEDLADARPADRTLARLVREAARLASAERGLPRLLGGIRRERLVRWDADSTTWLGTDVVTGGPALVRALRPELDEPALRRALARDARALADVVDGVRADGPLLMAPAPGAPLDGPVPPDAALTTLGAVLAALLPWDDAGLGLPRLAAEELRHDGRAARIVCLTPVHAPDRGPLMTRLAERLEAPADSPAERLLAGFRALPPRDAHEAAELLVSTLAEELTVRRVSLAERWRRSHRALRLERLRGLVARLRAAATPPVGRGAVGVDLEGRVTVVDSDGEAVLWGPLDDPAPIWTRADGLDALHARRMLRARAAAPPNPRLDAAVGGDPRATEAIGRWTAAALRLRTVRLLLARGASDAP